MPKSTRKAPPRTEKALLGALIQRVQKDINGHTTLEEKKRALKIYHLACLRVAVLIKSRKAGEKSTEWGTRMQQAMTELLEELQKGADH